MRILYTTLFVNNDSDIKYFLYYWFMRSSYSLCRPHYASCPSVCPVHGLL